MAILLQPILKFVYRPANEVRAPRQLNRIRFYRGYLRHISGFSFRQKYSIVFDRVLLEIAHDIPRVEVLAWFERPRPGWAEHDPEAVWWQGLVDLVRRLFDATGVDPRQILAVGLSAIAPDLLPVDKSFQPLRPGAIVEAIQSKLAATQPTPNATSLRSRGAA